MGTANFTSLVAFQLRVVIATACAIGGTAVSAQSDGSQEEAYARECPQQQESQVCKTLREAMAETANASGEGMPAGPIEQAGSTVAAAPGTARDLEPGDLERVWGTYARLPGTVWKDEDGTVRRYVWQMPGEVMRVEIASQQTLAHATLTRSADDTIDVLDSAGGQSKLTFPRARIAIQEYPGVSRATYRYSPEVIFVSEERFENGSWRQVQTRKRSIANTADFEVTSTKGGTAQQELAAKWGSLPQLAGYWSNGSWVWEAFWKDSVFIMNVYASSGKYWSYYQFKPSKAGHLQGSDGWANYYDVPILPGGGVFVDGTDDAIFLRSPTEFEFLNGRMRDGVFVSKEGDTLNGTFQRMSRPQALAFRQQIENYKRQQQAAKESSGDSGLLGALAMATGAALGGGNAEQVMGMAMKGAEMTTDNEMSRNVLAGQGDAMIASGVERMAQANAPVAGYGRSIQGGAVSSATSPALASLGQPAGTGAGAGGRPGYYACNSYNVTTKVLYFSPVVVRSYDDQSWSSRFATDFARFTAERFPGEYHGEGATCWARRSQAETESAIADSKRSTLMYGQTWRNVVDWVAPE